MDSQRIPTVEWEIDKQGSIEVQKVSSIINYSRQYKMCCKYCLSMLYVVWYNTVKENKILRVLIQSYIIRNVFGVKSGHS